MPQLPNSAIRQHIATASRFIAICWEALIRLVRFALQSTMALLFRSSRERRRRIREVGAECFAGFFRDLGATFIKIGQILSARPDLLPPYMIEELQKLQDEVPPFPYEVARATIENEFGRPVGEIFKTFDEKPIAAASVAQVHRAVLNDGTEVAVKVQRPGITETMERDLRIMRYAARALEILPGMANIGPGRMAREFARNIEAQLDFPREVRNNRRFNEIFADMSFVRVPDIHDELCGRHVITMEYIHGRKVTEILSDPPIDLAVLADRMIDIYMSMAFRHFFLHADLHPGNIFVDDDGTFVLIDTGLVHETPPAYARKFFLLYMSLISQDADLIVETYLSDADVDPARMEAAKRDTWTLVEKYEDVTFSDFEIGQALMEVFAILRRHRIYLDAELTGFFLSEITFEGIAKMLDSSLDLVNLVPGKIIQYVGFLDSIDADDPVVAAVRKRVETEDAIRDLAAKGFLPNADPNSENSTPVDAS